jgi:hypothetical protein
MSFHFREFSWKLYTSPVLDKNLITGIYLSTWENAFLKAKCSIALNKIRSLFIRGKGRKD